MGSLGHEVRDADEKGDGVFALHPFNVGDTVMIRDLIRGGGPNDSHAAQVGRFEYAIVGAGIGPKVNHSCDPNCGVRSGRPDTIELVALRSINPGEEIVYDYAMQCYSLEYFPERCCCGAEACRGVVSGWKDLPDQRKVAYQGYVAQYLLDIDTSGGIVNWGWAPVTMEAPAPPECPVR